MKTASTARITAWILWVACIAFGIIGAIAHLIIQQSPPISANQSPPDPTGSLGLLAIVYMLVPLVFATVGALIASRHGGNRIGWMFLAFGVAWNFADCADSYAVWSLLIHSALPGGVAMAALAQTIQNPVPAGFLVYLLLLFPDGRLPSRGWRFQAWLVAACLAIMLPAEFFQAPLEEFPSVPNSLTIHGPVGQILEFLNGPAWLLVMISLLAAAASLVVRYRSSGLMQREQIKWIALAGTIAALIQASALIFWNVPAPFDAIWPALFAVEILIIPIAVGIAILQYRLYDVDVIIRRTLIYAALTATLAAVYVGTVVLFQEVFRAVTGQHSDLAIVASTLGIAALFQPFRRRIQVFIDRRFYRRKYDTVHVLAAFGTTARDEVELSRLSEHLVEVVEAAMQPSHLSLWLRATVISPKHFERMNAELVVEEGA